MKTESLSDNFKIYPGWDDEYSIPASEILDHISFVFTMEPAFFGLYFKLKEPMNEGMDCMQFAFDRDNGIYINDGDMRFNDFMGQVINDSGVDKVSFIKDYLIKNDLSHLMINP